MEEKFDVIIAGGGIAGVLAATRINEVNPNARILLLEKEPRLGGRLKSTSKDDNRWGQG